MTSVFIDSEMQSMLSNRQASVVDVTKQPLAESRRLFVESTRVWNRNPPPMREERELILAGRLRAKLWVPEGEAAERAFLYFHGGGWTFGSPETHEKIARSVAKEAGVAVCSVDYRLAPEHPFPAAHHDALAAIEASLGGELGFAVQPAGLALAGDSAGANLCLSAMIARRDTGEAPLATALLFCGGYLPDFSSWSQQTFGATGDYGMPMERADWFYRNWLGGTPENPPPLAFPLLAEVHGLPSLYLVAAGADPMLDETLRLAEKLAHAGSPFELHHVPGVVHGFLQMTEFLGAARETVSCAGRYLRRRLAIGD